MSDSDISEKESALYGKLTSQAAKNFKENTLVLGLPGTTTTASLWLYVMAVKRVWAIPIIQYTTLWDLSLLGTLYIGLKYLSANPVFYQLLNTPAPFKTKLTPLKEGTWNRTFLNHQKEVVKIFHATNEVIKGNIKVVELAGI